MQFLRDSAFIGNTQIGARRQRASVVAHGELLHFRQQGFEILVIARQFLVIPGGRCIRGEHRLIRQIDARISGGAIGAQIEIEDLR
jgi:hypothetical protein